MSTEPRRLLRDSDAAVVAGVCAGLAAYLNVDRNLVRIAVVVLTLLTSGLMAIAYGFAWIVLPATEGSESRRSTRSDRGRGSWLVGAGAGLIVLGLLFVLRASGVWWSDALVWPIVLAAAGGALLWRQFSGAARADRRDPTGAERASGEPGVSPGYRVGFGLALILGAGLLFLYINGALDAAGNVALGALTVIVVLGLVLAPLWARLLRNLSEERAARIRSQERAEVAAHLHDSVLQTLALMQRHAGNPREVSTLARRQERELRDWLSGKSEADREASLADTLEATAAEVEEDHGVPIEAVTVGDRPLDEPGRAVAGAAREAMVNAARHAGDGGPIRMFAEISAPRVQVFVRDRGPGFALDAVPDDRRGVRDSILGRMKRNGGRAEVRSTPDEGTEIELTMETG